MLDEELNRFVTEWLPRSTANILYKPITWKASVRHSLQSVQVKHKSIQHTDVIQRDNKKKNIHATHIATNKWCTKWNSSEQKFVSAGSAAAFHSDFYKVKATFCAKPCTGAYALQKRSIRGLSLKSGTEGSILPPKEQLRNNSTQTDTFTHKNTHTNHSCTVWSGPWGGQRSNRSVRDWRNRAREAGGSG